MTPKISYLNAGLTQSPLGKTILLYTSPLASSDHAENRTTLGSRPGNPVLTGHHDEPKRSLKIKSNEKHILTSS